jgi:integrase
MRTNPATAVELIKPPRGAKQANRPWTAAELDTVLEAAPEELRAAIALGAFAGMREGDAISATWACYDGERISYRAEKTNMPVEVRAHARLRAILDATRRRGMLIVLGARGRQFTQNGFQSRFFKLIRALEKAEKIGPDLTFHGLRHTLGTLLAEAGCDPPTIASVLGHKTTAMAEHYSRRARRGKLADAAIARLEMVDQRERNERTLPGEADATPIQAGLKGSA